MLHYYYGDGKGKTTAAAGQAVRVLGHEGRVVLAAFLKDRASGEYRIWETLPGMTVLTGTEPLPFFWEMTPQERADLRRRTEELWERIRETSEWDLLVLDELGDALDCGLLPEEAVLVFLTEQSREREIVVTGHSRIESLCRAADYVTCMSAEKHPFSRGISARKGIEY